MEAIIDALYKSVTTDLGNYFFYAGNKTIRSDRNGIYSFGLLSKQWKAFHFTEESIKLNAVCKKYVCVS